MGSWVQCNHKQKLPVGEYLLRLELNGFKTNRHFTVNERQKELEIPYFNVKAYFRVPEYDLKEASND